MSKLKDATIEEPTGAELKTPITRFDGAKPAGRRCDMTWSEVLAVVQDPPPPTGDKKAAPWWAFVEYEGDHRGKDDVRRVHALCLDYDDEPRASPAFLVERWGGFRFVAHTSWSHGVPKGDKPAGPRWRVVLPYRYPVTAGEHERIARYALHPRRGGGIMGDEPKDPSRAYVMPHRMPAGYEHVVNEGELLDPRACLAEFERWEREEQLEELRAATLPGGVTAAEVFAHLQATNLGGWPYDEAGTVDWWHRLADDDVHAWVARIRDAQGANLPPLERLTLAAAVGDFLDRLQRSEGQHPFPWPGGDRRNPSGLARIEPGAVLPATEEERLRRGETWRQLWRAAGPLWPDQVAVLVGATGRGKSGMALQVAEAAARYPLVDGSAHPVLYVSAEMGTDELVARLLALRARGSAAWASIIRGSAPLDDVRDALEALVAECPCMYLWAPPGKQRNAAALEGVVEAVVAEHGRPPLVVLDYLQRFVPPTENFREAVSTTSGAIRELSRPGTRGPGWPGAAVLVLSSTARANYALMHSTAALKDAHQGHPGTPNPKGGWVKGDTPRPPIPLVGLGKESGEIEYDAPLLLVMTTDEPTPGAVGTDPRRTYVAVPKNRTGSPNGHAWMAFEPAAGRFVQSSYRRPVSSPAEQDSSGAQSPGARSGLSALIDDEEDPDA